MKAAMFPLMPITSTRVSQYSEDRFLRINVAGRIYTTLESTLQRFPNTLLGNQNRRRQFYRKDCGEYFFDRQSTSFEYILYYYQSHGKLYHPPDVPFSLFYHELEFFDIDRDDLKKLCLQLGFPQTKLVTYEPAHRILNFLWNLVDTSKSTQWGTAYTIVTFCIVLLSITTTCLETIPEWECYKIYQANETSSLKWFVYSSNNLYHDQFYLLECIICGWFSVELTVRFLASPLKRYFLFDILNVIDVVALGPQLVAVILDPLTDPVMTASNKNDPSNFASIRALRILRVFRLFTLGRHSHGLRVMGLTLKASLQELLLLILIILVAMLLFSSFIYFLESESNRSVFRSIPNTFWYVIVTITTVGYGDMVPVSFGGKIVGAVCAICGSLSVALAVPVIVNNFLQVYSYTKQGEMMLRRTVKYVKFRDSCMSNKKKKKSRKDRDDTKIFNHIS